MVAVVADSASNVPGDLVVQLGIELVPLHVRLGDTSFRDGVDIKAREFYERLGEGKGSASTSAPSPGDFLEVFGRAGDREIVCVTVAAGMSGAYQQARLAAEEFEGDVELVDSQSATMGEGFVAIEAARAARGGASLQASAARAREISERVCVVGAIQTFEHLRRSGRVGAFQSYAATMLDIKPVFRLEGGRIEPLARPRTRGKALTRLVEEVVRASNRRPIHVAAFHGAAEEDAFDVVRRIEARAEVVESFVVDSTPAIGAHTGPGLVGVAFFAD